MKRYDCYEWNTLPEPSETGAYVLYEDAAELQRQLAEVTRERDTLKAMVDLADALNDRRRAQAEFPGAERRVRHGR